MNINNIITTKQDTVSQGDETVHNGYAASKAELLAQHRCQQARDMEFRRNLDARGAWGTVSQGDGTACNEYAASLAVEEEQ